MQGSHHVIYKTLWSFNSPNMNIGAVKADAIFPHDQRTTRLLWSFKGELFYGACFVNYQSEGEWFVCIVYHVNTEHTELCCRSSFVSFSEATHGVIASADMEEEHAFS